MPRRRTQLADLIALRSRWRSEGSIVVWTNGCFDLVHAGHVEFLEEARALGDVLVVGLNTDESVRRLKGSKRPFLDLAARATVLLGLRAVDHVVVLRDDAPCHEIERLEPDVCCKDDEYAHKPLPEQAVVAAYGGKMRLLRRRGQWSTTMLAHRIAADRRPA